MPICRFYGAEICLALKYFHEHGILYRDMKLGNILIAPDGHVKIIDFGASKTGMDLDAKTSSFVGTVEFMAPEVSVEDAESKPVRSDLTSRCY